MEPLNAEELPEEQQKNVNSVRNVDKSLLDLFWILVETKQNVRVSTSMSLIRILMEKQEDADGEKSNELSYSIVRLVRGLSSTRKAARQGFCAILVEVLRLFPVVKIDEIIAIIEKHLPLQKKEDRCAMVIGRLLAYSAIIQSERLKDSPFLSQVMTNLYNLSLGKDYLQEATHKLMMTLFAQIDEERFSSEVLPHLKKELQCGWKCSPDKMWLLLLILRMFPQAISAKFLNKHWDNEDLLAEETHIHWKKFIKQSTVVHPHLHPVCLEFLDLCMRRKALKNIWEPVIEDNLFEGNMSEKTFLGFQIVKEVFRRGCKKKQVKIVMSPKLCSALARAFANKKHPLHTAANELAEFLYSIVKNSSDSDQQIAILTSFLQISNSLPFDQLLKKKQISLMIASLNSEAVKDFYGFLKAIALRHGPIFGEYVADEGFKRIQAVLQIGALVAHPAVVNDSEWRFEVIKFLFFHSYFSVTQESEDVPHCEVTTDQFSDSLRSTFRDSFLKALDSLNRKADSSLSVTMQACENLQAMIDYADTLLSTAGQFTLLAPVSKIENSWSRVKKQLKKIMKNCKKGKNVKENETFRLLFLYLGLQLFQDPNQIPEILEELEICYKKASGTEKNATESESEMEVEGAEDAHPWLQVLIDILLSLMSQSSHHLRNVVNSVFPFICQFMTAASLQLILDVISPRKENEESLMDEENDDDEEGMDFESGSSSEDLSDNEAMEDEDQNPDDFKLKLQKVLGPAIDGSGDEDSDVVLSDSEMFKLDDALSEAFRSRKKGHLQQTTEGKTSLNFRIRCLDMIKSYLKTEPPLSMTLKCIKPLLLAYESSKENHRHQAQFGVKCLNTLKAIAKMRKSKEQEGCSQQDVTDMLGYLINKTHKESNTAVSNILYSLCTFLVLCERKAEHSSKKESFALYNSPGFEKYLDALKLFVEQRNSHIAPHFFLTLMNACPEKAWLFVDPLEKYSFEELVLLFKRTQCLGLMVSALNFSKGQQSVSNEMWTKFAKRIVPKVIQALQTMMENDKLKPVYTLNLFSMLMTIESIQKEKSLQSVVKEHKELLTMLTSMSDAQTKNLTKKGKSLKKRLLLMLGA